MRLETSGWLAYELTGSAFIVGTLSGIRSLPFLIASPVRGVLTDGWDRWKLLTATQAFLALLGLGVAILVGSGQLQVWHRFVFTTLSGGA